MRRLGEIALISDYLAPLAAHPGALGLKDDAALLTGLPAAGLVVTADGLVAGVHFFEDDDPGDAAYKALAVNISDLAAKGARPLAYTMTLALSEAPTEDWARRFTAGLARAQDKFGIALIGGDTVTARGAWWISITAFGEANPRGFVPRGGAKAGDALYVSGTLGDAALGLKVRLNEAAFEPYLRRTSGSSCACAIFIPSPGSPWRRRLQARLQARWIYPTGWRWISPACARRRGFRPRSGLRQSRFRRLPAPSPQMTPMR